MRFKITGGVSQGLHYLREESTHVTVKHRDLKASNMLLDADMNPKISDFGLSELFGFEEQECTTRSRWKTVSQVLMLLPSANK